MWRRFSVVILAASLIQTPQLSLAVMAKPLPKAKEIQRQVERAGVGSYVALKLLDGKKLEGRIEAIGEQQLTLGLWQGKGAQLQVSYEQVAKLKVIKKPAYRAEG
jgi:hypothetical protein